MHQSPAFRIFHHDLWSTSSRRFQYFVDCFNFSAYSPWAVLLTFRIRMFPSRFTLILKTYLVSQSSFVRPLDVCLFSQLSCSPMCSEFPKLTLRKFFACSRGIRRGDRSSSEIPLRSRALQNSRGTPNEPSSRKAHKLVLRLATHHRRCRACSDPCDYVLRSVSARQQPFFQQKLISEKLESNLEPAERPCAKQGHAA